MRYIIKALPIRIVLFYLNFYQKSLDLDYKFVYNVRGQRKETKTMEKKVHRPETIVVRLKITGKRKNRENEYCYYLEDGQSFDVIYTADIEATDYRDGHKLHWTNVDLAFEPSSNGYNVFDLNQRPSDDWEDGKLTAGSSAIFDFLEITLPYGEGDVCAGDVVNPFLSKLLKNAINHDGSFEMSFKNSN